MAAVILWCMGWAGIALSVNDSNPIRRAVMRRVGLLWVVLAVGTAAITLAYWILGGTQS